MQKPKQTPNPKSEWQPYVAVIGGVLYTAALFFAFLFAAIGGLAFVLSAMIMLCGGVVSILVGIILFFARRPLFQWRFLIFAIASPVLLYGALVAGSYLSPEAQATHNADELVVALERYHEAIGSYPLTLNVLVPQYISEIPTTETLFGQYFYESDSVSYNLGHVHSVDRWTGSVTYYSSESKMWESGVVPFADFPFLIPSTPSRGNLTYSTSGTPSSR